MRTISRTKRVHVFCSTAALFALAAVAAAEVIEVPGTIQNVPAITTFQTWGGPDDEGAPLAGDFSANMEGIEVTVFFSGGASETATWTGTGFADPGGGVVGTNGDWRLQNLTSPPDHTYANPWELSYVGGGGKGNLVAFEIDGFGKFKNLGEIEGNTAFDTDMPSPGTPDSAEGNSFNVIANTHATTATYSDAIKLQSAAAPEGDLYRRLRVDFKGRIEPKWAQRPVDQMGENIHSDIDWRLATTPNGDRQAAADDFISDGRPITGVRWWGSYFSTNDEPQPDPMNRNLVPPVEEGFVISIFGTSPTGAPGPGELLGTYLAPIDAVDIQPTPLVGWDDHRVWEYAIDFDQTLLEHASDLAEEDSFLEREGQEYWISIAAQNGHVIDPATGETIDTGDDLRTTPWWGWHTTPVVGDNPDFIDDTIYAAGVSMPDADWVYAPWSIAPQMHMDPNDPGGNNFAFELLTVDPASIGLDGVTSTLMRFEADTDTVVAVPEPASILLITSAALLLPLVRRCRG